MEIVVGLDESAVGSLIGKLVAGAVILPESTELNVSQLCDSKKMTEKNRLKMFEQITKLCQYGIGEVDHQELDVIGLGQARRIVFHRALDDLLAKHPNLKIDKCIIDGTLASKYKTIPHECIPKADAKFPNVSAASIVAKVHRDNWVYHLCEREPELSALYGWKNNKGYPSKMHLEAIRTHGTTQYHRKSYGPCKNT
jgi:ribonuclease HII